MVEGRKGSSVAGRRWFVRVNSILPAGPPSTGTRGEMGSIRQLGRAGPVWGECDEECVTGGRGRAFSVGVGVGMDGGGGKGGELL